MQIDIELSLVFIETTMKKVQTLEIYLSGGILYLVSFC